MIGMLDTLLSEELTPAKKEEYMEEKYGVMMSVEGKEALNRMCNLSDLIEEKGIQKGRDEIIEKLLRKNYLVEQIAEMLDIDAALVENIEERLYIK